MTCPVCRKRRVARADTVCRTCRAFIRDYIDTGIVERRPVPMAADVILAMRVLGVDQATAVLALGGTS